MFHLPPLVFVVFLLYLILFAKFLNTKMLKNSSIEFQFMLEDARNNEKDTESLNDVPSSGWLGSQTMNEPSDTANVTLPLRKNNNVFSEELGKCDCKYLLLDDRQFKVNCR